MALQNLLKTLKLGVIGLCFLFFSGEIKGENEDSIKPGYFPGSPSGLLISLTGYDKMVFNRIGLKGAIYYQNEFHLFKGGVKLNIIDPFYFYDTKIGHEWYKYAPLISFGPLLDGYPNKWPSSNNQNSPGGTDIQIQPGVVIGYEFSPLAKRGFSLLPYIDFTTQYQFQRGQMTAWSTVEPWSVKFDGFFHVFSNFLGIGLEYQPIDNWAFRLSSSIGIGHSRVFTDDKFKDRIEEQLNRTFVYSEFNMGVRYRFSE